MRELPEWKAAHDDQAIPPRVRLRVFQRHRGICFLSGRLIRPGDEWDCDHIIALANGGSHSESNLAPVLRGPHREKTKQDVAEKSRNNRKAAKHFGIKKKRTITRWRRFDGSIVTASRER